MPKLTDEEVRSLRARKARGDVISVTAEADKFGTAPETIRRLLRGETFRHVVVTKEHIAGPSDEDAAQALEHFLKAVESERSPDQDLKDLLSGGNTPT